MTTSNRDADISLDISNASFTFCIGARHSPGPHVKGQDGLRYHYDGMLPDGQAGRQRT